MGQTTREIRVARGQCAACGKKAHSGACKPQRDAAEREKKRREARKDAGLCRIPGCERKRVGKSATCFECAIGKSREEIEDWVEVEEKKPRSFRNLAQGLP